MLHRYRSMMVRPSCRYILTIRPDGLAPAAISQDSDFFRGK